ncbi:MAG: hypothetical protein Q9160_004444 [Pyrenula sp. 1 TL-2023]
MDTARSNSLHSATESSNAGRLDTSPSPSLSLTSKISPHIQSSSTSSISSSPLCTTFTDPHNSVKKLLAEVREESLEREEDFQMEEADENCYHFDDFDRAGAARTPSGSSLVDTSYAFNDLGVDYADAHSPLRLPFKKARAGDSPISRSASYVGNRLPTLSKRWKTRTGAGPKLSIETSQSRPSFSRSNSRSNSAGSNVVSPALSASRREYTLPPSPATTLFEEPIPEAQIEPINIELPKHQPEEEEPGRATTPLLPPLLLDLSTRQDVPVQSPLQSPSVAETPVLGTPSPACTPQLPSLPSPPLSTKPSLASMRQRSRAPTLLSAAEIPPFQISTASNDIWSQKLGHSDYHIFPAPYEVEVASLETYTSFRVDWDTARCKYVRHLARTGEHYGTNSKIYKLTEEKWSQTNQQWQEYNKHVYNRLDRKAAMFLESSHSKSEPTATVTLLPIDDPSSRGKFPNMGDEDIVGPMAVAPALHSPTETASPTRSAQKRTFLKFLYDFLGRGTGLKA